MLTEREKTQLLRIAYLENELASARKEAQEQLEAWREAHVRNQTIAVEVADIKADRDKQLDNYRKLLDAIAKAGCSIKWDEKGVHVLNEAAAQMRRKVHAAMNSVNTGEDSFATLPLTEWCGSAPLPKVRIERGEHKKFEGWADLTVNNPEGTGLKVDSPVKAETDECPPKSCKPKLVVLEINEVKMEFVNLDKDEYVARRGDAEDGGGDADNYKNLPPNGRN